MIRRLPIFILMLVTTLPGADKTADKTLEILRELGGLQDQLKELQKSLETRFAALGQSNADQAHAAAEQAVKATAALGDRVNKSFQEQQDQQQKTLAAVAAIGSQLQNVVGEMSTVREAVNDLTSSLNKVSTQVGDLAALVKAAQAAKTEAPPEISATDLYRNAESDRMGGKFDLALHEYSEFASKFESSPQAADAQYYIGSIHYSNQEWDDAIKAFDVLIQKYGDSKRVPEAMYYKGDSLARSGHWPEADATLKELRKKYATSPLAKQSLSIKPNAK